MNWHRPNQVNGLLILGVLFLCAMGLRGIQEAIIHSNPEVEEKTAQEKPGLNPVAAGHFVLQPNKKPTLTPTATQTSTVTITPTPTSTFSFTVTVTSTRTRIGANYTFTPTRTKSPTFVYRTITLTPTRTATATRSWTPSVVNYFPFVRYFDINAYP